MITDLQDVSRRAGEVRIKVLQDIGTKLPTSTDRKDTLISRLQDEASNLIVKRKKSAIKIKRLQQLSTEYQNRRSQLADHLDQRLKKSEIIKKQNQKATVDKVKNHINHFNKIVENNMEKSERLISTNLEKRKMFYQTPRFEDSSLPHSLKTTTSTRTHNVERLIEAQLLKKHLLLQKKQQKAKAMNEQQKQKIVSKMKEHEQKVETIKARSEAYKKNENQFQKISNYINKIEHAHARNITQANRLNSDRKRKMQQKLERLRLNISSIEQSRTAKLNDLQEKLNHTREFNPKNSGKKNFKELQAKNLSRIQQQKQIRHSQILDKHVDISLQNEILKKGRPRIYDIVHHDK